MPSPEQGASTNTQSKRAGQQLARRLGVSLVTTACGALPSVPGFRHNRHATRNHLIGDEQALVVHLRGQVGGLPPGGCAQIEHTLARLRRRRLGRGGGRGFFQMIGRPRAEAIFPNHTPASAATSASTEKPARAPRRRIEVERRQALTAEAGSLRVFTRSPGPEAGRRHCERVPFCAQQRRQRIKKACGGNKVMAGQRQPVRASF